MPLQVKQRPDGLPKTVLIGRRWYAVRRVLDLWRIDDEWWRPEPISRLYCRIDLHQIGVVLLFHDLISGHWFRQLS